MAESVGWTEEYEGMKSGHNVTVVATDEGTQSQFVEATYTGVEIGDHDSFLLNLHDRAPELSD